MDCATKHGSAVPISLLALGGFSSGSGMRLLDPLLPMVAASLGVTVSGASVLIAGFMLPYGLGQGFMGPLGDRLGKLLVASVAVLLYGACVIACAAMPGLGTLVVARAMSGLFAGAVIPLMMAYLGDVVPYAERQATLGQFLTGMVMAQLITGPISGVIGGRAGWRVSFLVLGLFATAVGVLLVAGFGRTLWRQGHEVRVAPMPGLVAYLRILRLPAGRWLLISAFFDGFCLFGGAFPYVGSFLIEAFGVGAAGAGLIVAGFGLGSFVYTRFARGLVRRFGEAGLLTLGGVGLAAGLAGLSASPTWQVAAVVQVAAGLVFYMFHGVLQARATEALPEARGASVAAFALLLFMGQASGALAFGGLLIVTTYRIAFLTAGVAMAALTAWSGISLVRLLEAERRAGG